MLGRLSLALARARAVPNRSVEQRYAFPIEGFTPLLSYRGFHDVPRLFLVTVPDGLLVFDSPFDDDLDEYRPAYTVYFLPWSEAKRLHGPWSDLRNGAELRGQIDVGEVEFDSSRRLMVSTATVERFANPS